ncbi:uncharacterized protein F4817DRAFT_367634 [Daldinia loculata]|uniref:uncharacterized protein n=1 Tax=Daldinia loculata TaxID=103429 RepID=UPI0020C30458|nr:uncharacterized protein F4817DRAFT_367634 [Daldinia loculata]KAI1644477.1 hypothetical protein F4817DRAFT_367634 [Daldinia loculata]
MKVVISVLIGALGAVSTAIAGVKAATMDAVGSLNVTSILPEGYTAIPFSMDVSLEPGGEVMTFNGTVTEILAQIQSIKPDFTWENYGSATPSTGVSKYKRTKSKILCNIPNHEHGLRYVLLSGYDFLKNIHTDCKIDAGPKKCAMLYCMMGTSIWMCNDNSTPISRDCAYIATYVLDIIGTENCQSRGSMGPTTWTQGQEFDTDNFNVIAGGGGCS